MSERFKYAKNGICRVENFAEYLAAGIFRKIELGRLCGMNWYAELNIDEDDNEIYPIIKCNNNDPTVEYSVQMYSNLLKNSNDSFSGLWENVEIFKNTEKDILQFDCIYIGFSTPILEILDLNNGWLDDGALLFEYGIQVEAIMEDKIWRFNFNDKLFNAGAEMVQFDRVDDPNTVGPLYAHKLLLHFHSENLARLENYLNATCKDETWREGFIDLLQLCHGVRLPLNWKFGQVLDDANSLKMFNVVSYCDWYFVQKNTWESMKGYERNWILFANKFNLRHMLVVMIKLMMSLKEFLSEEDVEKMSNESMKMLIAKFLYEKF